MVCVSLLLLPGIFSVVFGISFPVTTEFKQIYGDCRINSDIMWQTATPSLTVCRLHCWSDRRCLSVSYHTDTRTCVLHKACPTGCSLSGVSAGWSVSVSNITICFATVKTATSGDYVGGSGGLPYTDSGIWKDNAITAVKLGCYSASGIMFVPMIQLKYGSAWGPMHGTDAFADTSIIDIILARDEYIVRAFSSMTPYVNSVQLFTNKKSYPVCGAVAGSTVNSFGTRLLYISGRSGMWLDGIHFHWANSFLTF